MAGQEVCRVVHLHLPASGAGLAGVGGLAAARSVLAGQWHSRFWLPGLGRGHAVLLSRCERRRNRRRGRAPNEFGRVSDRGPRRVARCGASTVDSHVSIPTGSFDGSGGQRPRASREPTDIRWTPVGGSLKVGSFGEQLWAVSVSAISADFTAAMAFQFASTNLVIELGSILALLIGWQFTLAEFVGGPVMILLLALLFRLFLSRRLLAAARDQAAKGLAGSMEGHAGMDMSVGTEGSFGRRLASPAGFTAVSHNFVMAWAAILRDLVLGLLIAGAAGAWIPDSFWQRAVPDRPPAAGEGLGADHRAGGRRGDLRLLDRQRAAGGGAVERRDQLRRSDQLHLRRPDHHPAAADLPEVLRHPDGAVPVRHLLRHD